MARPEIVINPEELEHLARIGFSDGEICRILGISNDTLRRRKKNCIEVFNAIDRGRRSGVAAVANALYDAAIDGNLKAQITYLRAAGWFSRSTFYVDRAPLALPPGTDEIHWTRKDLDEANGWKGNFLNDSFFCDADEAERDEDPQYLPEKPDHVHEIETKPPPQPDQFDWDDKVERQGHVDLDLSNPREGIRHSGDGAYGSDDGCPGVLDPTLLTESPSDEEDRLFEERFREINGCSIDDLANGRAPEVYIDHVSSATIF